MLLNNSEADPGHGPTALGTPLIVKKLLMKGIIFLFHFSFNLVLFPFLSLSLAGAWNDTVLSVNSGTCGHYIILLSIKLITYVVYLLFVITY